MKIVLQDGYKDCGVSSLLSIIKYYGGDISIEVLRDLTNTSKDGVSAYNLISVAKAIGFDSYGLNGYLEDLDVNLLPVIAHVRINKNINHFIVIYSIDFKNDKVIIMDPSFGKKIISTSDFFMLTTNNFIVLKPIRKIPVFTYNKIIKYILIKYINNNKLLILFIIILSLIYFIFNIILSFHFKYILEYIINYNLDINLFIISFILLTIYLFKEIIFLFKNIILNKMLSIFDNNISSLIINQILYLPYNYYKNRSVGEILNRIKDLNNIKEFIFLIVSYFFIDFISIIVFFILMFSISNILSLFVFIFISLVFIIYIFTKNKKIINIKKIKIIEDGINNKIIEGVNNFETIKNNHLEKRLFDQYMIRYNNLLNEDYKYIRFNFYISFIKNNILNLLITFIFSFGGLLVINNKIKIVDLFLFQMFFNYFYISSNRVFELFDKYNDFTISIKRINDLFNINKEVFKDSFYYLPYNLSGDIIYKNFNYKVGNRYLFKNINLTIKNKSKVLIIGSNGSGKSTLVKLLMRYILIDYGFISINGIDINHFHLENIRNNITYVSSNDYLYNDSIYNNIVLNKKVDDDFFNLVCKITMIDKLTSNNYNTLVEDNGFNFSYGERQKIILARSLIKGGDILILDEAFSQIDINSEKVIIKNIFNYFKDKTIIIISHRYNNKKLFDKCLKIKEGSIYEEEL